MDYISSLWSGSTSKAPPSQDEILFRNSTDQLPPEYNGFPTTPQPSAYPLTQLREEHHQQQQQQLQLQQKQKQQQQQQQQILRFPAPPQSTTPVDVDPAQFSTQSQLEAQLLTQADLKKGLVPDKPRTHFDSLLEEQDFQYDPSQGRPRIVQTNDVRSNLDLKIYFDRVIAFFQEKYPNKPLPNLNFNIVPRPGSPFLCQTERNECLISPLALGLNGTILRKIYRALTPSFQESQKKLIETTDAFFYSPERVQFNIAKALCEASNGFHTPLVLLKLQFLRFWPNKYKIARAAKEMESDSMAAYFSADIALGGLEHVTKLHQYRLAYQYDLQLEDAALVADKRFLNLLEVIESKYNILPPDAVKLALNPRAFVTDDPSDTFSAAENIVDVETQRQLKINKKKLEAVRNEEAPKV